MNFRVTFAGLPRVTTDLKRAKRNAIVVIDNLVEEMATAINLTSEAEEVLEQILGRATQRVASKLNLTKE